MSVPFSPGKLRGEQRRDSTGLFGVHQIQLSHLSQHACQAHSLWARNALRVNLKALETAEFHLTPFVSHVSMNTGIASGHLTLPAKQRNS
jgi:hypothetical protein